MGKALEPLLEVTIHEIADRLRDCATGADVAERLVSENKRREAIAILVERLLPLQEALTLSRLTVLRYISGA